MKDIKDLAPFCIPITRDLRDEDIGEVLDECVMRGGAVAFDQVRGYKTKIFGDYAQRFDKGCWGYFGVDSQGQTVVQDVVEHFSESEDVNILTLQQLKDFFNDDTAQEASGEEKQPQSPTCLCPVTDDVTTPSGSNTNTIEALNLVQKLVDDYDVFLEFYGECDKVHIHSRGTEYSCCIDEVPELLSAIKTTRAHMEE